MTPEEIAKIDRESENLLQNLQKEYREAYEKRWGKGSYSKPPASTKIPLRYRSETNLVESNEGRKE